MIFDYAVSDPRNRDTIFSHRHTRTHTDFPLRTPAGEEVSSLREGKVTYAINGDVFEVNRARSADPFSCWVSKKKSVLVCVGLWLR